MIRSISGYLLLSDVVRLAPLMRAQIRLVRSSLRAQIRVVRVVRRSLVRVDQVSEE